MKNVHLPCISRLPILSMVVLLSGGVRAHAQVEFPAPSPRVEMTQTVGTTDITVDYSRPGAKDREIFGGLVPYGEVWRTGANASTKITFENDVLLEGNEVEAGTYALYTIPRPDEWTIILSNKTDRWGASDYNSEDDAVRFTVLPIRLQDYAETFTIGFDDLTDFGGRLYLEWAHTRVPVMIETTDDTRIRNALETAMPAVEDAGNGLLYNAASYYRKHGGDLQQAQEWIDRVAERQPDAYWVHFEKARIEAARGEEKTAVQTARKALEKAKSAGADMGMIFEIQSFIEEHSETGSA